MKYIYEENLEDLEPSSIDIGLAESKGLAQNNILNEKYFLLQSLYYYYFNHYLTKELSLKNIENQIEESNPNMKSVDESDMDIYQYLSPNKYFYVRNTLYVEKLPIEVINYLFDKQSINNESYDEIIDTVIAKTYKIVVTPSNDVQVTNINYGPFSPEYMAPNNSVVMGIRFKEEDSLSYPTEDDWYDDYCERRNIITNAINNFNSTASNKLGYNIKLIEYFTESIKKKNFELKSKSF